MWDLPGLGIQLKSPALAGRFFTTEPPGSPALLLSNKLSDAFLSIHQANSTRVGSIREEEENEQCPPGAAHSAGRTQGRLEAVCDGYTWQDLEESSPSPF